MLPLRSSFSRTLPMSNLSYFASRTPSATFSKSQKTARLRVSAGEGITGQYTNALTRELDSRVDDSLGLVAHRVAVSPQDADRLFVEHAGMRDLDQLYATRVPRGIHDQARGHDSAVDARAHGILGKAWRL